MSNIKDTTKELKDYSTKTLKGLKKVSPIVFITNTLPKVRVSSECGRACVSITEALFHDVCAFFLFLLSWPHLLKYGDYGPVPN